MKRNISNRTKLILRNAAMAAGYDDNSSNSLEKASVTPVSTALHSLSTALIEPQTSTSKHFNPAIDQNDSCEDLITLSDLDDSVADSDYKPDSSDGNSSSDDSEQESHSLRNLLMLPERAYDDPCPALIPIDTIITNVFVAQYPGPIYFNGTSSAVSDEGVTQELAVTDERVTEESAEADERVTQESNRVFVVDSAGHVFTNVHVHVSQNHVQYTTSKQRDKHPMIIEACTGKCKRKCSMLSLEDRRAIWDSYWSVKFVARRNFLNKCVQLCSVKKRKVQTAQNESVKKESRYFFFPKDGEMVPVCRKFFLGTLGYKTDGVITELSKATKKEPLFADVVVDGRGGKRREITRDPIERHIMSYKPVVSHYRRHNAPNVKYLPRLLTLRKMHTDFKEKNPNIACGIEVYRKTLKKLNISFHMPKGDRCGDCAFFEEEDKKCTAEGKSMSEENKAKYQTHKEKAEMAIARYRIDAAIDNTRQTKYFSMDLQKVILLPEMPQYKDAFFISRLIAFNLTFAPIQKKSKDSAVCVLWHEGKAARDASNIVDAIKTFFDNQRDVKHFYLWADNCTAQNKNWTLFTALTMIVNSEFNEIETITISYLTKGHTHMTADAVHANIEQKIKRQRELYDFEDLKHVVLTSRKSIDVLEIPSFHNWPKKKRAARVNDPLKNVQLKAVVQVKFLKGSRNLFYKTRFDENFNEVDFLIKKFHITSVPEEIRDPRGVNAAKKEEILAKVVPMMPESRKAFWNSLPLNSESPDLINEDVINSDE